MPITPVIKIKMSAKKRRKTLSIFYPNDEILDLFKLKAFADNKINVTQKLKFVSLRVEDIGEKEKMLVTSIFSFSHNVFKSKIPQGH